MVEPSCPALVVLDDDPFRKSLIATLDQRHFTVTFAPDGEDAVALLRARDFRVVLLGLDLKNNKGRRVLDFLESNRGDFRCSVIILGEPDPNIRSVAPWADETLLRPVDPDYVATRARAYCSR